MADCHDDAAHIGVGSFFVPPACAGNTGGRRSAGVFLAGAPIGLCINQDGTVFVRGGDPELPPPASPRVAPENSTMTAPLAIVLWAMVSGVARPNEPGLR